MLSMSLKLDLYTDDTARLTGMDIHLRLRNKSATGADRSKYTIKIHNASAVDKHFIIFTEPPSVVGSVGSSVSQHVFLTDTIASGNTSAFEFTREIYAICGKKTPGTNTIQSGQKGPVRLGTECNKGESFRVAVRNGAARFVDNDPDDSPKGSFQISTGIDFDQGSSIFIGIGNKQEDGGVILTASVEASPNATVTLTPPTIYYAAIDNLEPGNIIDVSTVVNKAKFDLGGHTNQATAQYNANGTWSQS